MKAISRVTFVGIHTSVSTSSAFGNNIYDFFWIKTGLKTNAPPPPNRSYVCLCKIQLILDMFKIFRRIVFFTTIYLLNNFVTYTISLSLSLIHMQANWGCGVHSSVCGSPLNHKLNQTKSHFYDLCPCLVFFSFRLSPIMLSISLWTALPCPFWLPVLVIC